MRTEEIFKVINACEHPSGTATTGRTRASILVGLLWCVVLLALVVITVLHTATLDLRITKNYGDKIQAHYLALAGIEKAKALLHQSMRNPAGLQRELYDAPGQFRDIQFGRGQFRVFHRATRAEGGGIVYGVGDEGSRLNANTASAEELIKLDGLTVDTAAAIIAWRGQGGGSNANGASMDYYASLQPPYQPRNGPFETIRELLMVNGVTPELLFGRDTHQNGFLPASDEETGNGLFADNSTADDDAGWAAFLTVDSTIANVNSGGTQRVNIQTADETSLSAISGITPAIARAIVQWRNQHRFASIADLLDVTAPQNQNGGGNNSNPRSSTSSNRANGTATGSPLIDETLLMQIADDLTTDSSSEQAGLINLNTASLETVLCLPGVSRDLAQAIVSSSRSQGWLPNIASLLKVSGMNRDLFKQIAPRICTRSETFRILSEGRVKSTGAIQRIQAIVHVNRVEVSTVSYREDDL